MGTKRQRRAMMTATVWLSLLIWISAHAYCAALCSLDCGPTGEVTQPVEYTHEGCEGHPVDPESSGCKDPFCDSIGGAYATFDQFTFLKVNFPATLDAMDASANESTADTVRLRRAPRQFSPSPPAVSLATANQSHAPPFS